MRAVLLCVVAGFLLLEPVMADPSDLEGGVFIAHHPSAMQFSSDPPQEGWCQHYLDNYAITSCGEQVNRIDTTQGVIWFVLAAWNEEKEWCGVQFGLGRYNPNTFTFIDWGPCYPDQGLELPSAGWPGPAEGTSAVTSRSTPWSGNYTPVYFFAGYAYAEDTLPLATDPRGRVGGTVSCQMPCALSAAEKYGTLGLFMDGVPACPPAASTPRHADNPTSSEQRLTHPPATPVLLHVAGSPGRTADFELTLTDDAHVTLLIVDLTGRVVRRLLDDSLGPGRTRVTWSGQDDRDVEQPAGVYFARLYVNAEAKRQERVVIVQ